MVQSQMTTLAGFMRSYESLFQSPRGANSTFDFILRHFRNGRLSYAVFGADRMEVFLVVSACYNRLLPVVIQFHRCVGAQKEDTAFGSRGLLYI
jgi:hypothetical protein